MKENYFLTFLKGILMGIADVIPGVSGGTIAFITGIYDRLIEGIKEFGNFLVELFKKIFGKNKQKSSVLFSKIDFRLFVPLFIGIGISFLVGSQLISGLMEKYPAQVYSFFIGLVLASAFIIYRKIKTHSVLEISLGIIGFFVGLGISLIPISRGGGEPSLVFIFILGAIAICAMILPGISGAYIVLMFGQLKFMYDAVGNFTEKWPFLLVFAMGAAIGLLLFSRLLSFLLRKHHSKTLYALTGIMIGAIYGPVKSAAPGLSSTNVVVISVVLLVLGVCAVILVESLANRKK